ncbi:hypothetical protein [Kribbella koreensis]|uniref:hypothetical protein n=1 Tax=Kribbella koreensis TaxID=57909 RepID=UPI0031E0E092
MLTGHPRSLLRAVFVVALLILRVRGVSRLRLSSRRGEERTRNNVAQFASEWGYALMHIHVEDQKTAPDAFHTLIQQATSLDITTVIVPSLHHFAAIGSPVEIKDRLEHLIGCRVIPATTP